MKDGLEQQLLADDADFVARWRAAIAEAPLAEQPRKLEIMELCFSIERTMRDCSRGVRDCNVTLARMNGRFEMQNYAR